MILYRYADARDHTGLRGYHLEEWSVIHETPGTFTVERLGVKRRTVKFAQRPFVYADKRKALQSYVARKPRQIRILRAQLESAGERLSFARYDLEKTP